MFAGGVVDLRKDLIAPSQTADFGSPPQIRREYPRVEANHGPLAVPTIKNAVEPLVMDGRHIQGLVITEFALAAQEDAHGNFVRRANEKDRHHPQAGKPGQNAIPKRPQQGQPRILETGDLPGGDQLLEEVPSPFHLLVRYERRFPFPLAFAGEESAQDIGGESGRSSLKPKICVSSSWSSR